MNQGNRLLDSADDWMSRELVSIPGNQSVRDAAFIMNERRVGSLFVLEKQRTAFFIKQRGALAGLVTDTDIVRKVIAKNISPEKLRLDQIMSFPVKTIPHNIPTYEIARYFSEYKVKHLPVMKKGVLSGMLSLTDLMYAMMQLGKFYDLGNLLTERSQKRVPPKVNETLLDAKHWMTSPVIAVTPNTSILSVARLMEQHRLGSLPVVSEDNYLAGIITDTDLIRLLATSGISPETTPVSAVMTSEVITASTDQSIIDIAEVLVSKSLKRIPLTDKDKLVGIISVTDLATILLQLNNVSKTHKLVAMLYHGKAGYV